MNREAAHFWEANGPGYQAKYKIPIVVLYGPGSPSEDTLQLIGPVAGKHVLELGCGGAQVSIAFAQQGATVTALDFAASELDFARQLAERHRVAIHFIQSDMTDLSDIPSDSQDVVFSAYSGGYVEDLGTCFHEVRRVLRPGGIFLFSGAHPFGYTIDHETMRIRRSYFDTGKHVDGYETGIPYADVHRTLSDYFSLLITAGLVVDRLIEPDSSKHYTPDPWYGISIYTPERLALLPPTFIFRARAPQ